MRDIWFTNSIRWYKLSQEWKRKECVIVDNNESYFGAKLKINEIVEKYGTPLYIYDETILRNRCREIKKLVSYPKFIVDYSMKANPNPFLLKIIREEGLEVDAVS